MYERLVAPCVLLAITFPLYKCFHTLVRTFSLPMHRQIVIFPLNHLSTYSYTGVVLCWVTARKFGLSSLGLRFF